MELEINKGENMITRTKQNWEVGQVVKVGFMSLEVVASEAVKDFMPDQYLLKSNKDIYYVFIPHNGLTKIGEYKPNWTI